MYVLDTDHLTALERGGVLATRLQVKFDEAEVRDVTTTIISYEEQTRGWLSHIARASTLEEQIDAYRQLRKHLEIFCTFSLLDFEERAAEMFRKLQQMRIRVGTLDLKIASVALSNDAMLLTRNLVDFNRVPDLRAENWRY